MQINIDTEALVGFANKLEKINKSALPVSVRTALNKAAFDVKTNTMPASAKKSFIERKPTFFKANSKVVPALGFDINSMQSKVGFVPLRSKGNAIEDLQEQEKGGVIGGRSFIPLKQARSGTSWNRNVKAKARIADVKSKIVDSKKAQGKNDKEKFIKSAVHAGKGGWVIGNRRNSKGNKILFQIRSVVRKGKNTIVKSVPMFAVKQGRKVRTKATAFMEKAALTSGNKLQQYFVEEAKKRILK